MDLRFVGSCVFGGDKLSVQAILDFLSNSWQPAVAAVAVFGLAAILRFLTFHSLRRLLPTFAAYTASSLQSGAIIGGLYGTAIYFDVNPTTILAVVAIGTAGVALAAEQTINNAISGAVILASGKFAQGDHITIAGITGRVEGIGFSDTRIMVNTQGLISVPNSQLAGQQVINHTTTPYIELSATYPMHNAHDRRACDALIRRVLFELKLDEGAKVLHNWTPTGEEWAVVVRVRDYSKRRETMSKLSVTLSNALLDDGFPLGAVTYMKQV